MPRTYLVTLLTDFGLRDPYVAAVKGTILRLCPQAQIVDISHDVPPQDVLAGAFVWGQAAPFFPPGTVHVAVVDPGVGTERKVLAAQMGGQTFLFPDNGIITFISQVLPLEAIVHVQNVRYPPGSTPSKTFHGRDVLAPVAAQILNGLDLARLGPRPPSYRLLDLPEPVLQPNLVLGRVLYVDRFGNLISNISRRLLQDRSDLEAGVVRCGSAELGPVRGAYGEVKPGEPVALFNSMDLLEVAVNGGRANEKLEAAVGTPVVLRRG